MAHLAAPEPLDPLLEKHGAAIAALRAATSDFLPPNWDDIWLLRYCLGFPESERLPAVRMGVEWRAKHALILAAAAAGHPPPHDALVRPHQIADLHSTSIHGEPLLIVRLGLCSPQSMMTAVSRKGLLDNFYYHRERCESHASDRFAFHLPHPSDSILCSFLALRC